MSDSRNLVGFIALLCLAGWLAAAPAPLPRRARVEPVVSLQGRWKLTSVFKNGQPCQSHFGDTLEIEAREGVLDVLFEGEAVGRLVLRDDRRSFVYYEDGGGNRASLRGTCLLQANTLRLNWLGDETLVFTRVR
jgi:hypothetical protein